MEGARNRGRGRKLRSDTHPSPALDLCNDQPEGEPKRARWSVRCHDATHARRGAHTTHTIRATRGALRYAIRRAIRRATCHTTLRATRRTTGPFGGIHPAGVHSDSLHMQTMRTLEKTTGDEAREMLLEMPVRRICMRASGERELEEGWKLQEAGRPLETF